MEPFSAVCIFYTRNIVMCVEFTSILQDFPRIYNEFTDEYIGLL